MFIIHDLGGVIVKMVEYRWPMAHHMINAIQLLFEKVEEKLSVTRDEDALDESFHASR